MFTALALMILQQQFSHRAAVTVIRCCEQGMRQEALKTYHTPKYYSRSPQSPTLPFTITTP